MNNPQNHRPFFSIAISYNPNDDDQGEYQDQCDLRLAIQRQFAETDEDVDGTVVDEEEIIKKVGAALGWLIRLLSKNYTDGVVDIAAGFAVSVIANFPEQRLGIEEAMREYSKHFDDHESKQEDDDDEDEDE